MSESEIARIRDTIAKEYMAAKWGLTGEMFGIAKHAFISARMKRIEEGYKALTTYLEDKALELVVETLEKVPELPTRDYIIEILRQHFGHEADFEYLINSIKDLWKTRDSLEAVFEVEIARKIINAV